MKSRYHFTIGDGTELSTTERRRLLDAIGPVRLGDKGKRVYKQIDETGDWFYQVENDEQRDRRLHTTVNLREGE